MLPLPIYIPGHKTKTKLPWTSSVRAAAAVVHAVHPQLLRAMKAVLEFTLPGRGGASPERASVETRQKMVAESGNRIGRNESE